MQGIDFIAIDFETATGKRASICEAGICVVKDSKVVETKSWLVRPEITYYCSLRAARYLYDFGCNKLDYLCDQFEIPYGTHHRAGDDANMCAQLFLREIKDTGWTELEEMDYCNGML